MVRDELFLARLEISNEEFFPRAGEELLLLRMDDIRQILFSRVCLGGRRRTPAGNPAKESCRTCPVVRGNVWWRRYRENVAATSTTRTAESLEYSPPAK
jgi:hypothetical protein